MNDEMRRRLRATEFPPGPRWPTSPVRCFPQGIECVPPSDVFTVDVLLRGAEALRVANVFQEPVELRIHPRQLAGIEHALEDAGERDGKRLFRVRGDATLFVLEDDASE
jgi:hypothetical protein